MTELEIVKSKLDKAETPEEFWGEYSGTPEEILSFLRRDFARISKVVHPDHNPSDKKLAEETFKALTEIYSISRIRVAAGLWGQKIPLREKVIIAGKYERRRLIAVGDIADIFTGSNAGKVVIIKAVRFTADNDLLLAEQRNTKIVRDKMLSKPKGNILVAGIPEIIDSFLVTDGAALKRRINIVEACQGFYTADQVKAALGWVDDKTLTWMWKRLLTILEWVYRSGVIHGAILPQHVMFYPDNDGEKNHDPRKHALRLIGWGQSIEYANRTRLSSWVPRMKDFYAPEIINKQKLGPTTDMYMAAKLMVHLSGGDVASNTVGKQIPQPIADSILACLNPDPSKRPQSCAEHFVKFVDVATSIYGKPKWWDFVIPSGPAQNIYL